MRTRLICLGCTAVLALMTCGCTPAAPPRAAQPVPTETIPTAVREFARELNGGARTADITGTAWYPEYIPKDFVLEEVTSIYSRKPELEGPGILRIVFAGPRGESITFAQNSMLHADARQKRAHDNANIPWGDSRSSLDTSTPPGDMWSILNGVEPEQRRDLVYVDNGNAATLTATDGLSLSELKRIAASMRRVKDR